MAVRAAGRHPGAMTEHATPTPKTLRRSRTDRMVAGVCGGLGRYFDLNPAFFHLGNAAADADDHIIYDRPHGALYYDSTANLPGGAVLIAPRKSNCVF